MQTKGENLRLNVRSLKEKSNPNEDLKAFLISSLFAELENSLHFF